MAPVYNNILLAVATLSALSEARPTFPGFRWPIRTSASSKTLPLKELSSTGTLPAPSTSPKYIVLGVGFQNYTCSATTSTWVQSTLQAGAIADLIDITSLITTKSSDTYTKTSLKAFETCLAKTNCSPSLKNNYCSTCHNLSTLNIKTGQHFFNQYAGSQVPNFDIWGHNGDFFSGKRGGNAKAPASAYKGSNGLGAVDWLYLIDNGSGRTTEGLESIYRVETAGGVAPGSCAGDEDGQLQVPYTAEYWVYGS